MAIDTSSIDWSQAHWDPNTGELLLGNNLAYIPKVISGGESNAMEQYGISPAQWYQMGGSPGGVGFTGGGANPYTLDYSAHPGLYNPLISPYDGGGAIGPASSAGNSGNLVVQGVGNQGTMNFLQALGVFGGLAGGAGALTNALGGAAGAGGAGLPFGESGMLAGQGGAAGAGGAASGGFSMEQLLDPQYWNSMGGTTGLAESGAGGIAGSTSTYGGAPNLMQTLQQYITNPTPQMLQALQQAFTNSPTNGTGMPQAGGAGGGGLGNLAGILSGIMGLSAGAGPTATPGSLDPATLNAWYQSIMQQSMDPQRALHDRTQQQVVDASRAGSSARGLGMSPFGAGLENKAVSDFNIDWTGSQLGRNTSGLGAVSQAMYPQNQAFQQNRAFNTGQTQAGTQALLTGLNGLFGGGGSQQPGAQNVAGGGQNPLAWLAQAFGGSGGGANTNPNYSVFPTSNQQPYNGFTGLDSAGGPAFG